MFSNYNSKIILKKALAHRGFGLIELMVSITIITMVSAIIMTRQSAFNGAVLLRNQAYEVAFDLRQAQLLAVSGTEENASDAQQYGVYFNKNSIWKNKYVTFRDDANGTLAKDGVYNPNATPPDTQIGATGRIDSRFEIRDIKDGAGVSHNGLSITFKRPNFDGIFKDSSVVVVGPIYIDIARVGTTNSDKGFGDVRRIEVTSTGQISVVTYPQP